MNNARDSASQTDARHWPDDAGKKRARGETTERHEIKGNGEFDES